MAKIILHNGNETPESIAERRLMEIAMLSPQERWKRTLGMEAFVALFRRKELIKELHDMGILLTKNEKTFCAECKTKMIFE